MRKLLLTALTIVVALIVSVACGKKEEAATPTPRPAATATPVRALPTPTPVTLATTVPTTGGTTLEIGVKGDNLEFDKKAMTARAGESVVVRFKNSSSVYQHNWVLVKAGAKDDVATKGLSAGQDKDWVPQDDRIITNTKLINSGQTGEIKFTAPAAGTYQFVCTYPAHNLTMFGSFEVKG